MTTKPDEHFARIEREALSAARIPSGGPQMDAGPPGADAIDGETSPELIRVLLHKVVDPELGIDIVELGLLRDVTIEHGTIDVSFTVTTPACPLSEYIEDEIRDCLSGLRGVRRVNVRCELEPPWAPEQMTDAARKALGRSD
jgi:metal-sulfur cluster biosynthetic enzyme